MLIKVKLVVVVCCLAVGVSTAFASLGRAAVAQQGKQSASTKNLYLTNCARCHGPDGRGQTEQGKKLDVPDLVIEAKHNSTSRLTRIVTNGKQDMPAFGKKLTKSQINALASYVRKL